jgi:transposase
MISGANEHDGQFLIKLIEGIRPIRGKVGRPRSRPEAVVGDKAYTSRGNAAELVERRITPMLPARGTDEDRGLGKIRWVVERTFAWLHQFRRLRVRYERRADIHLAFLLIGCALIAIRSF